MKKNKFKKTLWVIIYFFLMGNLILLVKNIIPEIISKDFKIYAFDLISDSWCQKKVKEAYWFEDPENVLKKLMNKIVFLNVRNIVENPSNNLKIKDVYYFSNYAIVNLSKEFFLIKEQKNELYYIGSYLYLIKNNFKEIKEVKFLINGHDFKHLTGLYHYEHFIDVTQLKSLVFPHCS